MMGSQVVSWAAACLNVRGLGGSRTDLSTSIGRLAQFKWLKGRAKSDVYMLGEVNVVDSMMGQWTKEWGGTMPMVPWWHPWQWHCYSDTSKVTISHEA